MKSYFIFLLYIILLISCRNQSIIGNISTDTTTQNDVTNSSDSSKTPEKTVFRFLRWYKENEEWIHSQFFVDGGLEDSLTFYHINFAKVNNYMASLRSSGCLSEAYLQDLKDYLVLCNKRLQKYPQNDGPPDGLDFDLVMKSQDYEHIWDNLSNAKLIHKRIQAGNADIEIRFASLTTEKYFLSLHGQNWKIDSIGMSFKRLFSSYVGDEEHL